MLFPFSIIYFAFYFVNTLRISFSSIIQFLTKKSLMSFYNTKYIVHKSVIAKFNV